MANAYRRPAEGSLTRRIWDIADEETRREGRLAARQRVLDRALAEGINRNTASTQYHHWRKLEEAETRAKDKPAKAAEPLYFQVEMTESGRILLPADIRTAMGVAQGDMLSGVVKDGELRLMSRDTAIRHIQALVRKYVPKGVSLADELIAERRAENARDSEP